MRKLLLLTPFVCLFVCCSSNDQEKKNDEPKKESTTTLSKKPAIRLYLVDSIFYKYMPDTNLVFKESDELSKYHMSLYKTFLDFKASLDIDSPRRDSLALAKKQAGILYDDLREVNYMKFFKNSKRDNKSMMYLGAFSPHSRIISLQERINFFKTFPPEIQNNEIGRKTWKRFEEYSFDRNINFNYHEFDGIEMTDLSSKRTALKDVFNPSYKFYIIVFGASWCLPCRLEELQVKYWFNDIDSSRVKIVGLSIDKNINKWKKYLEEDKLQWDTYLLQGEMDNPMIKKLQFEGVPRNFLLDNTGKIIAESTDIRKILKAIPILQTE